MIGFIIWCWRFSLRARFAVRYHLDLIVRAQARGFAETWQDVCHGVAILTTKNLDHGGRLSRLVHGEDRAGDDALAGEISGDGTFGAKASQRNKELVGGQTVYLEKDVSETDGLDALLRYAWLEDGKTVNSILVAEGSPRPPSSRLTRYMRSKPSH